MQRSGFIEGSREEKQDRVPVISVAAPGFKLERENQGASLWSPGRLPRRLSRVRKARKEGGAVRRKSLDVAERMRKESGGW